MVAALPNRVGHLLISMVRNCIMLRIENMRRIRRDSSLLIFATWHTLPCWRSSNASSQYFNAMLSNFAIDQSVFLNYWWNFTRYLLYCCFCSIERHFTVKCGWWIRASILIVLVKGWCRC